MDRVQFSSGSEFLNQFRHEVQEPVPDTISKRLPRLMQGPPISDTLTMHIIINAENMPLLRQVAMTCGESPSAVRVQPLPETNRINVWLCLPVSGVDKIMRAIMHALPRAQFGRFKKNPQSVFVDPYRRAFDRQYSLVEEASWPAD